jgi:RnfABCDGE-type electron transport complex D subunit
MNQPLLTVSTSPHWLGRTTVRSMHVEWLLALAPAVVMGLYFFGGPAAWVLVLSVVAAVAAEAGAQRLTKERLTVTDLHAVLMGLLTGLVIPPGAPWWIPVVGGVLAVVLAKLLFGGLGAYPMNPVLVAWAALSLSWPEHMNAYQLPFFREMAETPLMQMKYDVSTLEVVPLSELWWGAVPGAVGATATWGLILGGLYLVARRLVPWQIPAGVLLGAVLMGLVAAYADPELGWLGYESFGQKLVIVLFHLGAGGLMLTAFFLAPEPVSSPVTPWGMFLFGLGVGFMTVIVRTWGGPVEGAFYGVLVMNAATPLFDRLRPKVLGKVVPGT